MESDSESDYVGKEDFSTKQEFCKVQRGLISVGYREGAVAGKDASFQLGFDAGYAEGFTAAYALGKVNGAVETLKRNAEAVSLDKKELEDCKFDDARRALCKICVGSSAESTCSCKGSPKPKDITVLAECQRALIKEALNKQRLKYPLVFERLNVELINEEQETAAT